MKPFLIFFFGCIGSLIMAQSGSVSLNQSGTSIKGLTPMGYKLVTEVYGDLNGDKIKDLVLVVQGTDTTKIQYDAGEEYVTIDTNRRILGIYFGDNNGMYHLHFQNDEFIELKADEYMEDPFDGIEISNKGVLKIKFNYWMSAGTWESSNQRYLFQYNSNLTHFELIGYATSYFDRSSFEGKEHSINFPAGRMSITTNPMLDDHPKPEWKTFTLDKLKTLDEIAEPGSWEFMGLYL